MFSDLVLRSPGAIFLRREITGARAGDVDRKNPATTREGVKAGRQNNRTSSSLPSSGRWRDRCPHHTARDLMRVKKQVFWLRGRSTLPALPRKTPVADWHFVARYSGATARDSHPLPYSSGKIVPDTFPRL